MGIIVRLKGYGDRILGASWASPIKAALYGTGAGEYHSPQSHTALITGKNKATLSGVDPTITNVSQFRAVRALAADGQLIGEWRPSRFNSFAYNALTSELEVKGADWSKASVLDVEISGEHRGYAPTESAWQSYVVNPEHAWTAESQSTASAQGDGTTPYYFDVDTYKFQGIDIQSDTAGATGDNTYTIWASWEDNGTADTAAAYKNVTLAWFGVAAVTSAMIAADPTAGIFELDMPITAKFIKLQVVRANDGAATDGAWTIDQRRTY
jgi:hypothetical protein